MIKWKVVVVVCLLVNALVDCVHSMHCIALYCTALHSVHVSLMVLA